MVESKQAPSNALLAAPIVLLPWRRFSKRCPSSCSHWSSFMGHKFSFFLFLLDIFLYFHFFLSLALIDKQKGGVIVYSTVNCLGGVEVCVCVCVCVRLWSKLAFYFGLMLCFSGGVFMFVSLTLFCRCLLINNILII